MSAKNATEVCRLSEKPNQIHIWNWTSLTDIRYLKKLKFIVDKTIKKNGVIVNVSDGVIVNVSNKM